MPPRADRILAVIAFILACPAMLVIAALVRLHLGRPVLFRQMRGGLGGGTFELVKFRTMRAAHDAHGVLLPDAERVSRLGRLLRRSRLDELPELVNIMRGDMALVGPRPLPPETIAAFGARGARRSQARPGLTGWAQVNGNTLLSADEKLSLDLWYIDRRSSRLDLLILLRTLAVIVGGERRNSQNLEKAVAGSPRRSG